MVKKFVFVTSDIHYIGGVQNYVKSKIKYLLADGWKIYALHWTTEKEFMSDCFIRELEPYTDDVICFLCYPEGIFDDKLYKITLFEMLTAIEYDADEECEYVIESHADLQAIWGEILARAIKAKHICFTCNEGFRGSDKRYEDFIDFFDFKYGRGELAGISENSMKMLFEGYKDIDASDRYVLKAATEEPVQDIHSESVNRMERLDWNIAYIGRCEKEYVPLIIEDIFHFAVKYPERKIQFIIVGILHEREKKLLEKLNLVKNLKVTYFGFLSPIPRDLFKKLDASIAGAGCAMISSMEGVPTILADAKTYKAAGILGYTVQNTLYGEREYSYAELLENVLVTKDYLQFDEVKCDFYDAKRAYDDFFVFIERSSKKKEYYKFEQQNIRKRDMDEDLYTFLLTNFILCLLKKIKADEKLRLFFTEHILLDCGKEIGLFGYGVIGKELVAAMPGLSFKKIYDNQNISPNTEKPTEENLNEVSVMLISPIKVKNEIADELVRRKYRGKIVYIEELFSEIYYDEMKMELNDI